MKTIEVFCDDISVWLDKNLNRYDAKRCSVYGTEEPSLIFQIFGIDWVFYIYGMNNTDMVPEKIKKASYEGCRPDIWFYDRERDEILLAIEETATAPVGNALKQRIPRPMWAIDNNIPFLYISPIEGMDNSNKQKRKITGPFYELVRFNPQSFITKEKYNLVEVMEDVSKENTKKYLIKSPFKLSKLGKTKLSVKKTDTLGKVKQIIDSDYLVENVIEKKGNIYLVPKESKTAEYFGFVDDTILLIGKGWKSSKVNGFSDPFCGGIMMVYYINKWSVSNYKIAVLSTHDCIKYDTNKLIKLTNKMTLSLSKIDSLFDLCGNTFDVSHTPNEIFKFQGLDESIATYVRAMDLIKEGFELDFCQGPHGSWASKDGLNTQKRDEKRGDIYHKNSPNGEEGKTKLSDVVKHIKKYGLIHDKYYYLVEDCEIEKSDKIIKVSF